MPSSLRISVPLPTADTPVTQCTFLADWDIAQEKPFTPRKKKSTGKKIAVVGAGPSGLTAAYYSAISGHDVTVFERHPQAGGMMRYGIPEYRLPKATLDKEIDMIKNLGGKNYDRQDPGHSYSSEGLE